MSLLTRKGIYTGTQFQNRVIRSKRLQFVLSPAPRGPNEVSKHGQMHNIFWYLSHMRKTNFNLHHIENRADPGYTLFAYGNMTGYGPTLVDLTCNCFIICQGYGG